jgi:hypothetical protein
MIVTPQAERALQLREMRDAITPGARPIAIVPRSFGEVQALCEALCRSDLVPKRYKDHPQDMMVVVMSGAEIGIAPMAALRLHHVIEGTPRLSAEGIRVVINSSPDCEYFEFTESSDTRSTWIGKRRGRPEKTVTWTIERARKAGLLREGSNWIKYPDDMLNARASMQLGRLVWPHVMAGMQSTEETLDGDAIDAVFTESPAPRVFVAPARPAEPGPVNWVAAAPTASDEAQRVVDKVIAESKAVETAKRGPGRPPKAKEEGPPASKLEAAVAAVEAKAEPKASPSPESELSASAPSTSIASASTSTPTPSGASGAPGPDDAGFGNEDPEDKPIGKSEASFRAWLKTLRSLEQAQAEAPPWINWARETYPPVAPATTTTKAVPHPRFSELGAAYSAVKAGLK